MLNEMEHVLVFEIETPSTGMSEKLHITGRLECQQSQLQNSAVGLGGGVLIAFQAASFDQFDHLLDRQVFCPEVWSQVKRFENLVDLRFGQDIFHCCEDFAAQEFSSMEEHSAEACVEEFQVDDPSPFLRVGYQSNDC